MCALSFGLLNVYILNIFYLVLRGGGYRAQDDRGFSTTKRVAG